MAEAGRNLQRLPGPIPLFTPGHVQLVVQDHIQKDVDPTTSLGNMYQHIFS